MNKRNIILGLLFVLAVGLAGCGDQFLNRTPEDQVVVDNYYQNVDQLRGATAPLYNVVWFTFNDKAYLGIGDYAAGNIHYNLPTGWGRFMFLNLSSGNDQLIEAWQSFYTVIGQSNMTIMNIESKTAPDVPEEAIQRAIAEARFMRGTSYLHLVRAFGAVPIITDNVSLIDNPDVPRHKVADVYQFLINDLEFAAETLPITDEPGRVTRWSALGMLSEAYLSYAGWGHENGSRDAELLQKAKDAASKVIHNSGLTLMDNYADLFKTENDNNPESLFALQWVYGGGWGTQNTLQAYLAYDPALTGVGDGWGGGTQISTFLMRSFTPQDSVRRKAIFMLNGDHYPDLISDKGGYTFTATNSGIKKYVVGTPKDNDGKVGFMETPNNSYMQRLAEVYLIYAETILGDQQSTSDSEALTYYNAVRERAGLDPKNSITFMDIFMEKWKELALEGQNWYDLVRWHYFEPNAALDFINNQERNTDFTYTAGGDTTFTPPSTPVVAQQEDFTFPLPEQAVVTDPNLTNPPEDYDFTGGGSSGSGQ